jgi:hypothetical protein
MKHSTDELMNIARAYHPPGIAPDDPRYQESEEYRRLMAARRDAAAAREPWRAMMRRLAEQFPGRYVHDNAFCCPAEALDVGYDGYIDLPAAPGEHFHTVELRLSFLVPYYVVYATRTVDDVEATTARRAKHQHTVLLGIDGVCYALPRQVVKPEILTELDRDLDEKPPVRRCEVRFDLSPEEQLYSAAIVREIETTYGYEPMPPEIGSAIVPDVVSTFRWFGEASLYDCLVSQIQ